MRHLLFLILAFHFLFCISGCETVRGAGKDMQKAGKWMEKKSQ